METKVFSPEDCAKKINKIESMLKEVKQNISYFSREFQESIEKGEEDIKNGRITVCKTEKELDNFFVSI
jgi:hypothetical protein